MYVHMCIYICVCVCVCACVRVCVRVCMYVSILVYVYVDICISHSRAAVNAKRWLSSVPWAGKCVDSGFTAGCLRFAASSGRDMYIKTQELRVGGRRPQAPSCSFSVWLRFRDRVSFDQPKMVQNVQTYI